MDFVRGVFAMTSAKIAPTRIALASWLDRQADPRVHVIGRIVVGNLKVLEREPDRPGLLAMTAANVARLQQAINGS